MHASFRGSLSYGGFENKDQYNLISFFPPFHYCGISLVLWRVPEWDSWFLCKEKIKFHWIWTTASFEGQWPDNPHFIWSPLGDSCWLLHPQHLMLYEAQDELWNPVCFSGLSLYGTLLCSRTKISLICVLVIFYIYLFFMCFSLWVAAHFSLLPISTYIFWVSELKGTDQMLFKILQKLQCLTHSLKILSEYLLLLLSRTVAGEGTSQCTLGPAFWTFPEFLQWHLSSSHPPTIEIVPIPCFSPNDTNGHPNKESLMILM